MNAINNFHSLKDVPVYVINLDRRPDRWNHVKDHLTKHMFWNVNRLSGVDGKRIDTDQLQKLLAPGVYQDMGKYRKSHEQIGSLGCVGCYLSHYKAWGHILKSGKPGIIVEDDMILESDFSKYDIVYDTRPLNQYDMVLLGYLTLRNRKTRPSRRGLHPYKGMFWGLHFYYLTPKGAERLIAHALPLDMQVDSYMSILSKKNKLSIGYHHPNMSIQDNQFGTDIQTPLEDQQRMIKYHEKNSDLGPPMFCVVVIFLIFFVSIGVMLKMSQDKK